MEPCIQMFDKRPYRLGEECDYNRAQQTQNDAPKPEKLQRAPFTRARTLKARSHSSVGRSDSTHNWTVTQDTRFNWRRICVACNNLGRSSSPYRSRLRCAPPYRTTRKRLRCFTNLGPGTFGPLKPANRPVTTVGARVNGQYGTAHIA